jgi:ADP-heptose:LPS heptosyltransferase
LAALAAIGAAARTLPPVGAGAQRPRVLAVRPDHLGDVLLTTAALAALRRAEPEAEIVALVGPWSCEILRRNPDVDRVLVYPFPWFDRGQASLARRYAAAGGLAAWLRTVGIHRAYLLRSDHWWGAMAAALAGIPERVGYGVAESRPFLTRTFDAPSSDEHVVRSALRLVGGAQAAASGQPGSPATRFFPSATDRAAVANLRRAAGFEDAARYVVVHPGASTPLKRWPTERWAALLHRLTGEGTRILLTHGPGEAQVANAIAGQCSRQIGRTPVAPSLGQLGALFEASEFALGMDSAPMHLATAVGTPTVRLVGPSDERLFGPWGEPRLHRVVRAPGTIPDPDWFEGGDRPHPTLQALDVATVAAEVARLREAIA